MRIIISLASVLFALTAMAGQAFSYSDLSKFSQKSVRGLRSMNDGRHYTAIDRGAEGMAIVKYSYATGMAVDTLFSTVGRPDISSFGAYELSVDEAKLLIATDIEPIYRHSYRASHLLVDLASGRVQPLSENGKQQVPTFSPDGEKVAFVRDNDLYVSYLNDGAEVRVTNDGLSGEIINGIPDWVYEEEFAFARGYQWSPASDALAYYRSDESAVKEYNMTVFADSLYPKNYTFKYPKAGEKNSVVSIHTYNLADARVATMDVGEETDQYIPRIKWNGDRLAICRVNRLQNRFDLLMANPETGESTEVYTESNPRYVERIDDETVTFLADGDRFVVKSEQDGNMHLYIYSVKRGKIGQLTAGNWDVTSILGVDEKRGKVYFMSCETSPLRRNLYSVGLDGKGKKRLTTGEGTYKIDFSRGFNYYISHFSNITTPNLVTLHSADGKVVRTLEDNAAVRENIAKYEPPVRRFFTFKNPQGVELHGYMICPADFDSTQQYPLFMTQYSGPASQQVADRWRVDWEDVLAQQGYIVVSVDPRGTGFRGEEFKKCTYRDLGRYEVEDQIAAARYLGSLPYVDNSRIGIYGWSYGGFMALNCILQGADVFKMAIAVAPVTSWRYYDTIYTEIYNGLPADNPAGYDNNSPIMHADKLKGRLLLAHGTGDDNVHIQNSMAMINRLVASGKQFDMYIYPDGNHGMGGGYNNLIIKCLEYVNNNL